jgi:hypothetical protein
MPLSLRRGTVTAVLERLDGLARLEVDGRSCVAFPRLTGPVALGDEVIVNVQARELGLGSGGFDVLYGNLTRGLELAPEPGAHVMTLPYTPLQTAVRFVEEDGELAESLAGLPVVCCSLHSQVTPACAGIGEGKRVAYVQLPGGALPVSFSDSVRALKARGWAAAEGFEIAVCAIGPGVVGTASRLGHGGVAAADAANAASALQGSPVLAVRVSEGDARARHRGVSHHTRAALELTLGRPAIAWPAGLEAPDWLAEREEIDVGGWREACEGLRLEHMGRGPDDDPWFFAAAFAAGRLARRLAG